MSAELLNQLQSYLTLFGGEPWKKAAIIVVSLLLIAWALSFIINKIVQFLSGSTKTIVDDQMFRLLRRPLIWTVFLSGLIIAANILELPDKLVYFISGGLRSVIVWLWTMFCISTSRLLLKSVSTKQDEQGEPEGTVRPQTLPLFTNLFAIIIYALGVYFLFQTWGIDMTAWLASAGIIGIAIGFAAKDTLANLFSGVFILADGPYKLGDYVVLEDNSRGKVTHIGLRSTRMLTRDDVEVTVPNSIMGNTKIINQSGGPNEKYRIRIRVSAAYGSDTEKVENILMAQAVSESLVCKYPAPRVRFREFGPSGLAYELLCWIDEPELSGRAIHQLNTAVHKAFTQNKIEIPFPKQDLYVKQLPKKFS